MTSKDQKLLYQLNFEDEQTVFVKISGTSVATVPTKEDAEVKVSVVQTTVLARV